MYEIGKEYVWGDVFVIAVAARYLKNERTTVIDGPIRCKSNRDGVWRDYWLTSSVSEEGIPVYAKAGDLRRIDPPAEKDWSAMFCAYMAGDSKQELDRIFSTSCENAKEASQGAIPGKGQPK